MRLLRTTALSLLIGACAVSLPVLGSAQAQIVISIGVPPPPLPVYVQPPIPAPGFIWTPGYWSFDDDYGYFWVPGTWVEAPRPGLLWTPGYWGYDDGRYGFHEGYWGEEVGFYGGVDYGYGYGGVGYGGGYWQSGRFFYNRTVNNISNVQITNVYSKTVINENRTHVSYNGGQGGLSARPTPQQQAFSQQTHVQPTSMQRQHVQLAQRDPGLRETVNKGRPSVAATSRPSQFSGPGVVQAKTAARRPAGQQIPQGKGIGSSAVRPGGPGTPANAARTPADAHRLPTPGAPGQPAAPGTSRTRGGNDESGAKTASERRLQEQRRTPNSDGTAKPGAGGSPAEHRGERQQQERMRPQAEPRQQQERTRPQTEPRQQQERTRPQNEPRQQQERARPQAEPRQQQERARPQAEPRPQGAPHASGGGERGPGAPGRP